MTARRAVARLGAATIVAAAAFAVLVLPPAGATTLLQPTNVNVADLTGSGGYNYPAELHNCGTSNSSATPGDYSFQSSSAIQPTDTGDDTGGMTYGFQFPDEINDFTVTLTAPAPAEPAGVPPGVYGTIFPPEAQHIDQGAANSGYGCNVNDFTVYNYAVALTINGEHWLYTPDGLTYNSAQNQVTIPVDLGGGSSSVNYATGSYDSGSNDTTITYDCGSSSGTTYSAAACNFVTGDQVSVSGLGSTSSGPNLNVSDATITSVDYDTFTVVVSGNLGGASATYQNASAVTEGSPEVTAMTVYVANVVNPVAGTYPGVDYTVDVDNLQPGSSIQYSTVPAPAQTTNLTYVSTGVGDALTSTLAISSDSIEATNVPSQGATVTATVRDQYYNPIVGETVYVGVEQPLDGAIFTEPTTTGSGPGGLPQTGTDGTVQYYVWGTKATDVDLPAALFGQATDPDSFYFGAAQTSSVTSACGTGSEITYAAANNYAPGESVTVTGLPVTSNGDDPDVTGEVTSATISAFTLDVGGVYDCAYGLGVAQAEGLTANGLSGESNGSVYSITGDNNFSPGQQVSLSGFTYADSSSAPTIDVAITAATPTGFTASPVSGSAWTANAETTGGTATTTSLVTAATVTGATGDGTTVTYDAYNDFSAGQSVSVQGLSGDGGAFDVGNQTIASANGDQFTIIDGGISGDLTSTDGLATASGPLTVTMAVTAGSPSPPSAGPAPNGVSSSVQACPGAGPCSGDGVSTSVEVGNGQTGDLATVTVTLADQFGNYDADRAVELTPIQPSSGSTLDFKGLTITPYDPPTNTSPVTDCDQGPAADLPGVSCTDENGVTSFVVSDTRSQTVSFQIVDVTDGFTMPTTDLPPEDVPNIPIVTFNTGPVDPANSTVSVDGGTTAYVPANGTSYGTVTVTLRDQFGNPEPGVAVSLAGSTGGPVSVTAASGDGSVITYLADNTFNAGETVTVSGLTIYSGGSLNVANATITSASPTQFTVASSVVGVASGTGTATPGEHDVVTGVDESTCNPLPTAGETDCNGQTWFEVSDSFLESVSYTASEDGTAIPQAGQPVVNFVTGAVSYANSSVSVAPQTIVGNGRGTTTVTVTLKDDGGHPLDGIVVSPDTSDSATITAASGNGSEVTYTAPNNFTAGQLVDVVGLGTLSGSSLNLSDVEVASATSTQFVVDSTLVGVASGGGTATLDYSNLTVVPPVAQTDADGQATFEITAGAFGGSVQLPTSVAVPVNVSPAPKTGNTPIPSPLVAEFDVAPLPTSSTVSASPTNATATVTAVSGNGTIATYNANNSFSPGQVVTVTGLPNAAFDVTNATISTSSSTQFTIEETVTGTSGASGTAVVSTPVANSTGDEDIDATILNGSDGINGLSLELVDSNGDVLGTTTTNSSGQAQFSTSLAPTAPDFTITYEVKDLSDGGRVIGTVTVTFVPEANEADESTVSAHPASVYTYDPADEANYAAQQTANVTVHLVDGTGQPISGNIVELEASSPFAEINGSSGPAAVSADGDGDASFAVTDCNPDGGSEASCAPSDVTAAVGDGTTVTYTANNDFSAGQSVSITGLEIASGDSLDLSDVTVESASPTQFTVASSVVGTALVPTASVTAASGDGTTVTYTADNAFSPGQRVSIAGLGVASGASLDLSDVTVATATPTQFTVTNTTVGTSSGTGVATAPGQATLIPTPEDVTFTALDLTSSTVITRTATVDFVLRPDEAFESTIDVAPTVVEADGTSAATVTVTLKNNGAAVAGDLVSLSQGSGHATITSASPVSNSHGVVTFQVVDLTPEAVVLQATDLTTATTLDNDAIVTFTAPPGGTLRPSVSSVAPNSGTGAGGSDVTITGTNLLGATAVWFGAVQSPTFSINPSGTALTAVSPIPVAEGVVNVTVTGPGGTSATSPADTYTYTSAPPFSVAAISPSDGSTAGGTTVTISGTGLASALTVHFGSTSVPFTLSNGGQTLTATAPAAAPGTVPVTVVTSRATSAPTPETTFTFLGKPPVTKPKPASVTTIRPDSGALKGGNLVTIDGHRFTGAKYVLFGSVRSAIKSINHAGTILVVRAPRARAAGTVSVVVVTPAGRSAAERSTRYTYRSTSKKAKVT